MIDLEKLDAIRGEEELLFVKVCNLHEDNATLRAEVERLREKLAAYECDHGYSFEVECHHCACISALAPKPEEERP